MVVTSQISVEERADCNPLFSLPSPSEPDVQGRLPIMILLCAVGFFNFVDRQVITTLFEPIKREFQVSDSLIGVLTGLTFAGFYTLASIPIGRLADRTDRRVVLAICLGFWSLCTCLAGFAQSFGQLALTRVGVAVGEAGGGPTSHAILADRYPRRRRATVLAIFSGSQAIGVGAGILIGGVLAETMGWRAAFWIVGAPGLILAAIVWRVIPPGSAKNATSQAGDESFWHVARFLWKIADFRRAISVCALASLTGYGILNWGPTFFMRVYGMTSAQVGVAFGLASAVSLMIGTLAAAPVADRLSQDDLGGYMRVASVGLIIGTPAAVFALSSADIWWCFTALFVSLALQGAYLAPCLAVIQTVAPPSMRAQASVLFGLSQALFGLGFAPALVGILNDVLTPYFGLEAIRWSLILICSGAMVSGLLAFRRGWRRKSSTNTGSGRE